MGWGAQQSYILGSKARSPHRAIGGYIAAHIADETPDATTYVGIDRLSRMSGRWRSDVSESIAHLEELGEIRITRRKGRTSLYSVEWTALDWPTPNRDKGERHDLERSSAGRRIADLTGITLKPDDGLTGRVSKRSGRRSEGRTGRKSTVSPVDSRRSHRSTPDRLTGHEPPGTHSDRGAPSDGAAPGGAGAPSSPGTPPGDSDNGMRLPSWSDLTPDARQALADVLGRPVNIAEAHFARLSEADRRVRLLDAASLLRGRMAATV